MGRIFISYRRDDASGHAGRVHDRIASTFGRDVSFMDVDAVPLGMNFATLIQDEVARCTALLAVIGPGWLDARDEAGQRRLDDPNDFVRLEIAAALARNIPVVPLLLEDARIPRASELPDGLKGLARRQGVEVRHRSFDADMARLISACARHLMGEKPASDLGSATETAAGSGTSGAYGSVQLEHVASRDIRAPIARVWGFIDTFDTATSRQLNPQLLDIVPPALPLDRQSLAGATYKQRTRVGFGLAVESEHKITAYVPLSLWVEEQSGGGKLWSRMIFRLTANGDDTRLEMHIEAFTVGGFFGRLFGAAGRMRKQMEEFLDRLKYAAEH